MDHKSIILINWNHKRRRKHEKESDWRITIVLGEWPLSNCWCFFSGPMSCQGEGKIESIYNVIQSIRGLSRDGITRDRERLEKILGIHHQCTKIIQKLLSHWHFHHQPIYPIQLCNRLEGVDRRVKKERMSEGRWSSWHRKLPTMMWLGWYVILAR